MYILKLIKNQYICNVNQYINSMKRVFYILGILVLFQIITSCANKQEEVVDKYFEAYNNDDTQAIKKLFTKEMGDRFVDLSKMIKKSIGKINSYTKYSSESYSDDNNASFVDLYYECKAQRSDDLVYFKFTSQKSKGDDILVSVLYSTNKNYIDDYNRNKEEAVSSIEKFYDALKNDEKGSIEKLLDDNIREDEKMLELFFDIIETRKNHYGKLDKYDYEYMNSELVDNETYFYVYFSCESDENESFAESFSLRLVDNEIKIFNYQYAKNLTELKED